MKNFKNKVVSFFKNLRDRIRKKTAPVTDRFSATHARYVAYQWSDKNFISRQKAIVAVILVLVVVVFARVKPYLKKTQLIVTIQTPLDLTLQRRSQMPEQIKESLGSKLNLRGASRLFSRSGASGYQGQSQGSGYAAVGDGNSRPQGAANGRVLSRPLFDNLTVSVEAVLTGGISLSQAEQGQVAVEAKLLRVTSEESQGDSGETANLIGASLSGSAQGLFDRKKIALTFTEIVTSSGERFPIQGIAIDPESKAIGVAANYSSGMASRILGVTLGRALTTADQFASRRVLQNTDDTPQITRELLRNSLEASNQPLNELNQEVTRDLRETKAVVSLDAGTVVTIRLKSRAIGRSPNGTN